MTWNRCCKPWPLLFCVDARCNRSRGCVNTDLRFDQQLDLIVADNDFNKDGRVTGEDFRHDSAHNYDANGELLTAPLGRQEQ